MIVIVICAIVLIVRGENYAHTKVGYVFQDGNTQYCINDCIKEKCFVDDTGIEYKCYAGWLPAPVSYTFQRRHSEPVCRSRCAAIGTSYAWCYIDDSGSWDYCNGNNQVTWILDEKYTISNGPCMSECVVVNKRKLCFHFWSFWDVCQDNTSLDYVQAHTINNALCRGKCDYYDGSTYKWCYYGFNKKWDRCAPPTHPRMPPWWSKIDELVSSPAKGRRYQLYPKSNSSEHFKNSISQLASNLEKDFNPSLNTIRIKEVKNPVYKYIYETVSPIKNELQLPVLVRADISKRNVREPCKRSSKDCVSQNISDYLERMGNLLSDMGGWLIPYSLGGRSETYNMVPMNSRLIKEHYLKEEKALESFLRVHKKMEPQVKIDVFVIYDGKVNRPFKFLKHTKLYLDDRLEEEYFDVLPNF